MYIMAAGGSDKIFWFRSASHLMGVKAICNLFPKLHLYLWDITFTIIVLFKVAKILVLIKLRGFCYQYDRNANDTYVSFIDLNYQLYHKIVLLHYLIRFSLIVYNTC